MKMRGRYEELSFISSVNWHLIMILQGCGQIILRMVTTQTSGIIILVSTLLNTYIFCEIKMVAM